MPSISKIRFTNVIYEGGNKRYNDEIFLFDGHNGAILLENGGGKTVFIQTAIQTVLPHADLAERKIKDTLKLEDAPAHIAIEWILNDYPRRYALTCVSLFLTKNGMDSYRYVYEYGENDKHSIEQVPFVRTSAGKERAADRGEIQEYYSNMVQNYLNAKTFDTIKSYKSYLEQNYHIISKEWESIIKINSAEGGVEHFFDECKTTGQLFDRLLIPTVEESMAGFQKDEFAQTFEKHRNSFKEYKQLKEKIAENEKIKERVGFYVETFEGLDEKNQEYEEIKGVAKAYFNLVIEQQMKMNEEQDQLNTEFATWEEKQRKLEQKHASYEIAVEKEKLEQVAKRLAEELEHQARTQESFEQTETLYYSLKLAQHKKNYQIEEQTKILNEEKLQELDKEFDLEELLNRMEENNREIKGYFVELEEKLEIEQKGHQFELEAVQQTIESEKKALEKVKADERDFLNQRASKNSLVEKNRQEMKELRAEILSNPKQERVEEQLQKWIEGANELDMENARIMNRNKELRKINEELNLLLEEMKEKLTGANKEESKWLTKKEKYDEEHQKLKWKLADKKLSWSRLESVYLKQDSIEKQVMEEINKLTNERNQLLDRERLAFRFVDDYGNLSVFYADPYLSSQIDEWKNQFSYLETGVSYIQSLQENVETLLGKYPLWPITLITSGKEKLKVQEKIKHISERIQYPVNVLSIDEATTIIHEGDFSYSQWITPQHWERNSVDESFANWIEVLKQSAEEAKQKRQEKEKELQQWQQLEKDIVDFFAQYPFNEYQDLSEQLTKVREQIFYLETEEKKNKEQLRKNQKEYEINGKKHSENIETINGYVTKMEKGQKYVRLKKETEGLESELSFINKKTQELGELVVKLERALTGFQERADDLKQNIRDISIQLSTSIHDDRLYQQVKDLRPTSTSKTIEVLERIRHDLQLEMERLSKGRSELEAAVTNAVNNMERLQNEMDQLRMEKSNLDEALDFPLNGKEKMDEWWSKRKELATQIKILAESVGKLSSKRDKLEGSVESMMKKVTELFMFDIQLETVRKQLEEEKLSLISEKEQLQQWSVRVQNQLKDIHSAVIELEKYDPKHQFLIFSIKEAVLSPQEMTDFMYSRLKRAKEIVRDLETRSEAVQKERDKVERAKSSYIAFCRQEITDIRMRETAIKGIDTKQSYKEVLKYKELLEGRIQTAINYAEQNIRTHDQELEQFITHVHMHIKKIADELKLIPRKTSVKVEDQWKEIFSFHIPDWDEQEGKADIRAHINWILEQLDKEGYKDETGLDDAGKIKKDLEKWLQSKQLLQVVMKNKMMKVTCRKVTNDNKITKGSFSWEQSNVWSGGEKWSKNMTLFLGILNYIAEKQAAIQPKMKRHRTVLMDNPFGKASSDHVLNPVFFIAEQLGFQIIALTAHAEGKFLKDYFPVIYSCRLRNATGSNKQIMTKEKTIKHAFFQDHDPRALERLGEVEQLGLF